MTRPAPPALFIRAAQGGWAVFRRNPAGKQRLVAGPWPVMAAAVRYIAQVEGQRGRVREGAGA